MTLKLAFSGQLQKRLSKDQTACGEVTSSRIAIISKIAFCIVYSMDGFNPGQE